MLPCNKCKQCNRKGKPSVTRGSAYCDSHKKQGIQTNRVGFFRRAKDFISERRYQSKTTKGFRKSWFWN